MNFKLHGNRSKLPHELPHHSYLSSFIHLGKYNDTTEESSMTPKEPTSRCCLVPEKKFPLLPINKQTREAQLIRKLNVLAYN